MTTAAVDQTEIGESPRAMRRLLSKKPRRSSKRTQFRNTIRPTASSRTGTIGDRAARNVDSEKSSGSEKLLLKPRKAVIPARSWLNGAGVVRLVASRICRTKISRTLLILNGREVSRQLMTANDSIINFLKVIFCHLANSHCLTHKNNLWHFSSFKHNFYYIFFLLQV